MPQRASKSQIGSSVGKMIFQSDDKMKITQRLKSIDHEKFQQALHNRGLGGTSVEKIADELSGNKRGSFSYQDLKNVVHALQDVEVAKTAKSADEMLLTASRQAQDDLKLDQFQGLTPTQVKRRMEDLARERRQEANVEEVAPVSDGTPQGILDRMRTPNGRSNASAQAAQSPTNAAANDASSTLRELRERYDQLKLQPKIVIPKPKEEGETEEGFQA